MGIKICVVCNTEKSFDIFYNKYRECKQFNIKRSLKRYYENNDKISSQRKIHCEKNRDKLLQKQNNRYLNFKELQRPYVKLQNRKKRWKKTSKK